MADAPTPTPLPKSAAKRLSWKQGYLRWKLDPAQQAIYDAVRQNPGERIYCNMSRRRGKTYFLCLMAIECALKGPNREIKYAASTAKAVKKMVKPNFRKILKDCPAELRPKWVSGDGEWVFPNGSTITVAGCDNENYENLRGTEAHLIILDECGFVSELKTVVEDVLAPQSLETGASILAASTPPKSLDHYSISLIEGCQRREKELGIQLYFHQTVYDNPRLTPERLDKYLRQNAGNMSVEDFKKTPTFRREYLAELIPDMENVVIPEWVTHSAQCIGEQPRPSHFDAYVSQDIGYVHGWGVVFGYWDSRKAKLVIEDELFFHKGTSDVVAAAVLEKERELWGKKRPWRRVSDNQMNTIGDMGRFGAYFIPTEKTELGVQIDRIRQWVAHGKLLVHPRCRMLIHQLQTTLWNKHHTKFAETTMDMAEDGDGGKVVHGDLLAALIYLGRNVDMNRNPYPAESNVVPFGSFRAPSFGGKRLSEQGQQVAGMLAFKPKKS